MMAEQTLSCCYHLESSLPILQISKQNQEDNIIEPQNIGNAGNPTAKLLQALVHRSSLQNVRGAKTRYLYASTLGRHDFPSSERLFTHFENSIRKQESCFDHAYQYHCTVSLKTGAKTNVPFSCSDTASADANCKVSCTQNLSLRYGEMEYQPR